MGRLSVVALLVARITLTGFWAFVRTEVAAFSRSISGETLSSVKGLQQILAANKAVLVEN